MSFWAFFPLALQAVYAASALPPLLRLVETKRSDQHTVSNHVIALCAHVAMLAWAHLYARQPGIVLSVLASICVTSAFLATILHYRRWPGGRPHVPRAPRAPTRFDRRDAAPLLMDARRLLG